MYRIKLEDLIVQEHRANNTNTHLPRYIVCTVIDAIASTSFEHFGLLYLPSYELYDRTDLVLNRGHLIDANKEHFSFARAVLRRLVNTIDIRDIVVYTVQYDVAILKIGSYLITPVTFSGVRVLNEEEEMDVIKVLLSYAYGLRAVRENKRFTISMKLHGKEDTVSVGTKLQPESSGKFLKLKIFNGLEFMESMVDEEDFKLLEKANNSINTKRLDELLIRTYEHVEGALREAIELLNSLEEVKHNLLSNSISRIEVYSALCCAQYDCLSGVIVDKTLFRDIESMEEMVGDILFKDFKPSNAGLVDNDTVKKLKDFMDSDMVRHIITRLQFYKKYAKAILYNKDDICLK